MPDILRLKSYYCPQCIMVFYVSNDMEVTRCPNCGLARKHEGVRRDRLNDRPEVREVVIDRIIRRLREGERNHERNK